MIKKLIVRSIFFSIPIILLFMVGEYLLQNIPNDYSYKKKYLEDNAERIEILILGNSHAYRSIIAEKITLKSFNAAYISQSLDLDFLIFNKYQENLKNLDYIIINISYPSLFNDLKTSIESWRIKNYNLYYGFNMGLDASNYSEILGNPFDLNWNRLNEYYLNSELNLLQSSKLGSGTIEGNIDLIDSANKAVQRHTNPDSPFFKGFIEDLNVLIKVARKNNIKVVFSTTPVYKTYFDKVDKKQLNLMNRSLDSIVNSNNNVYRFDLLNDKKFNESDFYDADHLNREGAIKFTIELDKYLKELSD